MLIVITMEVKITNSWLFREYLSAINENLGILATIFIAISRGLVAIKARFLVRDITREQRRFGGFLVYRGGFYPKPTRFFVVFVILKLSRPLRAF